MEKKQRDNIRVLVKVGNLGELRFFSTSKKVHVFTDKGAGIFEQKVDKVKNIKEIE